MVEEGAKSDRCGCAVQDDELARLGFMGEAGKTEKGAIAAIEGKHRMTSGESGSCVVIKTGNPDVIFMRQAVAFHDTEETTMGQLRMKIMIAQFESKPRSCTVILTEPCR